MRAELINTGSELLLGQVVNTHLAEIARQLFPLGVRVTRQVTVPDGPAIRDAIAEAMTRADVIFVTGGLGPTSDDLTRDIAAELTGRPLRRDETVLEAIRARFAKRGLDINDRIARQADVPEGARVLPNPNGTAPGLHIPAADSSPHIFLLPGPPRELRPMLADHVLPAIRAMLPPGAAARQCRVFKIAGLGESLVEEKVGAQLEAIPGLELGYCARPGAVDVRLIGEPETLERAAAIVTEKLGRHISATDEEDLPARVLRELRGRNATLAVAESCTGGLVSSLLTDVPGSSAVFLAGFVTYANAAKESLGVPSDLIANYGAVSEEVARAMARAARERSGAAWAVATTGIAGPDGGSEDKPVGTLFLAADGPLGSRAEKRFFPLDRASFKQMAARVALDLLRRELCGLSGTPWQERVVLLRGDISSIHADGIVNAANSALAPGSGVCGALHRAAGPALAEACARSVAEEGEVPPGSARATKAGRLVALRVIHAVAPVWRGGSHGERDLLRQTYDAVFAIAKSEGLGTLAVPAIGTGVFGWPKETACKIALAAARDALETFPIEEIRFVLFSPEDLAVYQAALAAM